MEDELDLFKDTALSNGRYKSYVREGIKQRKRGNILLFLLIISLLTNLVLGHSYKKEVEKNISSRDKITDLTINHCSTNIYRVYDIFNDFSNNRIIKTRLSIISFFMEAKENLKDAYDKMSSYPYQLKHVGNNYMSEYHLSRLSELLFTYLCSFIDFYNINISSSTLNSYIITLREDFHNIYFELFDPTKNNGKNYIPNMSEKEFSDKFKRIIDNLKTENVKYSLLNP